MDATWPAIKAAACRASAHRHATAAKHAAAERRARPDAPDVATVLVSVSVQETPRKPGVFGLWRPLSRSDFSRFGSFLDR